MTITAAADGSALGNPGPAGWAWYIDDDHWRAGGWAHGTNNMGELMAVLDLFRSTAHLPDEELHILCDSQYVINSVTKWMPGWKKKGWKKSDGKPVLNLELLKDIDAAIKGRKYRFEWVKGHAGHELNEAADDRARAAATAYQAGQEPDAGPGLEGAPGAAERAANHEVPAPDGHDPLVFEDLEAPFADREAADAAARHRRHPRLRPPRLLRRPHPLRRRRRLRRERRPRPRTCTWSSNWKANCSRPRSARTWTRCWRSCTPNSRRSAATGR